MPPIPLPTQKPSGSNAVQPLQHTSNKSYKLPPSYVTGLRWRMHLLKNATNGLNRPGIPFSSFRSGSLEIQPVRSPSNHFRRLHN